MNYYHSSGQGKVFDPAQLFASAGSLSRRRIFSQQLIEERDFTPAVGS